jgi:hypothetical protein
MPGSENAWEVRRLLVHVDAITLVQTGCICDEDRRPVAIGTRCEFEMASDCSFGGSVLVQAYVRPVLIVFVQKK